MARECKGRNTSGDEWSRAIKIDDSLFYAINDSGGNDPKLFGLDSSGDTLAFGLLITGQNMTLKIWRPLRLTILICS